MKGEEEGVRACWGGGGSGCEGMLEGRGEERVQGCVLGRRERVWECIGGKGESV